ncbi:uncharacterized protein LOC141536002 [Cotesia typhae]|uniref:uncharacterized protein LOC141536002 n=1 Tax=Cotesia typhae TaxID=2053667 RepID=UPI003D680D77
MINEFELKSTQKEEHLYLLEGRTCVVVESSSRNLVTNILRPLVERHVEDEVIDDWMGKSLKTVNGLPPRLYGLRKVHKAGCKMRPVVSCIKSPCYKVAKFLHTMLTPVIDTFDINVKNSVELVELCSTVRLPEGYVLVSLDVVSLFTNIPKELVLSTIEENWDDFKRVTKLWKKDLIDLVTICFDTSYFTFNNEFYIQLDGSAMGNPASPTLANLVMYHVLNKVIRVIPFRIAFLKLYVDDTLLAVSEDRVEGLLTWFNGVHPKIQFTMEKEVDNKLPFLDTVVFRLDSGELRTNWYQKPSCSGRLLNFNSHHPIAHKISVVLGLMFRAFRLSHADFYEENLLQVRDILHRNNYPRSFIDVCLRRFENLHKNRDSVNIKTQENRFRFPFIRGLSRYISLSFRSTDWRPAFYNIRTVSEVYSKLKAKTVWNQKSELVYSIPCSCGKAYVGQTKQYLSRRIYQHKYSCQDKFRDKEDLTALALHHFQTGQVFNFDSVRIVDRESNFYKRNISEMVQIFLRDTIPDDAEIKPTKRRIYE